MSSEDSSSEEDTEKLKEATWSFVPAKTNGSQTGHTNECGKNGTHSRRTVASEHEKDGNELETTPEFRAHVAKKLGNVLDSCIAEVSLATVNSSRVWSSQEKEREKEEEEDEGFRLFSTSVPGMSESAPVPSLKRRPLPSSSDSDSEMDTRIKEAAVTISDIVRPYYTEKTEEKKDSADPVENKEDTCGSLVTEEKKKKKKKKKIPKLEEDHEEERKDYFNDGNLEIQEESTQETPQLEEKKKKKKKKKKKVEA
ncbi:protein CUSTOS [Alosa pseudoharengus]|uniref:protein CUSTOS n=1 Tax=Alosa pseudoharengus TaxID=34774 RepID=UPI003F8BE72E